MTADTITSPATESRTGTPLIAVIGNPNTGKSTVFNALCGTRQRVANYPGVTVEKKLGYAHIEGQTVELLDLPGLYSLRADSPDEQVASDAVMGRVVRSPDAILFILDATNLKRNLYLFSQVRELDLPVVVALTMTDLLTRAEIKLNIEKLRDLLEVPVIPIVGRDAGQLKRLKHELSAVLADNTDAHTRHHLEGVVDLSPTLERCAGELKSQLAELYPVSRFEARELILDRHIALLHRLKDRPDVLDRIRTARERYEREGRIQYTDVATARYRWAELVISKCEVRAESRKETLTNKLDRFFTHRAAGLLAFVSIMYLMFQAIYSWAGPLMDGIEWSFGAVGDLIGVYLNDWPVLQSLLVDGVIGGVGSVVIFVPQIAILFLFIAVMEDSGYLARASFLMDRLLSWTGLNGRAFIPMLSSFACAVPGIMAARVMPDPRARMATILVAPLMSCSARLPVYVLLIGAFIEPQYGAGWAAFTLFAMHGVGLVFALPIAWILNRGVLRTPSISFVLEIPPYRMPRLYNVAYRSFQACWNFLRRAGTIIFALSIVIWALSYFPRPDELAADITTQFDGYINIASNDVTDSGQPTTTVNRDNTPAESRTTIDSASQLDADTRTRINAILTDDSLAAKARVEQLESLRDHTISSMYLEDSYLGRLGKTVQPLFAPLGFDWKITIGILGAFPAREVIIATLGIIYNVGEADEESPDLKSRMSAERHPDGRPVFTPLVAIVLMVFFALCSQCMSTLAVVRRELNSWKWAGFLFVYMTGLAYLSGLVIYQVGTALGFQ